MQEKSRLFGTNGVRGTFCHTLTMDMVIDLVHSLAAYFGLGHVIIGCDGRKSSPILTRLVQATLLSDGCEVSNAGSIPTPCLQYSTKSGSFAGGIMITASHNPPEYNGLKPIATDGVEVPREDELKIENLYRKKNFVKLSDYGVARNVYLNSFYLQEVLRLLDADKIRARKFKVVMDLGNGVQGYVSPILCGKLGCKVIPVNGVLDGNFPGRGSEPTPDNLLELSSLVREVGADFGVAYDGDGDRSIFCDDKGVIYTGDRTGALLIRHLLSERHLKTDIVCPGNTSIVVSKIAKELGSKVVYTKVGSVEVSREMIKKKALIGLEENGGFMYGPLNEVRDGAMTTALLLEMLASNKNSLSDLLASLPVVHQYKTKFHSSNKSILRVIIKECINHGNPTKVETLDGAKIWIDDETWIMIRPSGTEPLIRMYAESTDKDLIDSKVREYTALINKVIGQNMT